MVPKQWPVLFLVVMIVGCGMVDPDRPVPQPDTNVFGNLLEVVPDTNQPEAKVVKVRVGLPRSLVAAQQERGKPTPATEEFTTAEVTVSPDTVVLVQGRPGTLDEINSGTEVAAIPLAGSTRMMGASRVLFEASYFMDFDTYRSWRLPSLAPQDEGSRLGDPARINGPGVEHSPIPVGDGHVLYFTERWRRPWKPDGKWFGTVRDGLPEPEPNAASSRERTYRTELGAGGWSRPALVAFPGLDDAQEVRVTWMSPDETRCLVTVRDGAASWVGAAERKSEKAAWGEVARVAALGEAAASDAVYLKGSNTMIAFASDRPGGMGQRDLFLYQPGKDAPQPLDPRINTPSDEWAPRVGATNQLLFCRMDRQLLYAGGVVTPLRLPGPYREVLTEANPTTEDATLFFCEPQFTPVELGKDLYVAPWEGKATLGKAVPVDDWRVE